MVLESLPNESIYTQLDIPLDSLLNIKPLYKEARLYLATCKIEEKSPRTIEVYGKVISAFINHNNNQEPNQEDVTMFLMAIKNTGVSPNTQHIYYRSLRTWFNWMVRRKSIKESPMANMKPPKLPDVVIIPLTQDDIKRLLIVTSGLHFIDYRNRAMVLMFLDTGIRLLEMSNMKLEHYDVRSETIKVYGKGGKERIVRIGKTTQKALLTYLNERRDSFPDMWVSEERRPLTRDGVQVVINRLLKKAEVKSTKRGPHILRHTSAITYLRNGGDVFTLQTMLGHSTLDMTRRYTKSLKSDDVIRVHKLASPVDNLKL